MSKKILRITLIIVLIASFGFLLFAKIKNNQQNSERPQIVASNFPAYDFARSVAGEQADVKLLLKPGTDAHSFVPTPQDIIDIQNSNLFIYVGGESDAWIEKILNNIDKNKTHLVKMLDIVGYNGQSFCKGVGCNDHIKLINRLAYLSERVLDSTIYLTMSV